MGWILQAFFARVTKALGDFRKVSRLRLSFEEGDGVGCKVLGF